MLYLRVLVKQPATYLSEHCLLPEGKVTMVWKNARGRLMIIEVAQITAIT